ncbi:alpha/beta hydrolase family protein [Pontibacter cellulosilyticus]|uniref:Uncharacterized protein n=1 Tax=Pontibacter cellulosilyticus TaxID=1720253 RepID=A0A923N5I4_9BACT|nr:hypothetical protein [Pontibacter cellulosilyticus]MBC5992601.1 hypothetical protein [Pontibacter cellulosilyticus]
MKALIKYLLLKISAPKLTASLIGILLLLTQCQPVIDEDPQPSQSLNAAATLQTVTTFNGSITQTVCQTEVMQPSGEIILICVPANWNGELILYARGYTPAFEQLHIADEASIYAPLFTSLGYAFATTSYSDNGLAVQTGIQDMIDLRNLFIERYGMPEEIYLTGASEGGLVTTLAIERYPELWSGGLSLCGPCGDFQRQLNYYGNFRVLFDFFFPGVLPGTLVDVPQEMILNWETVYIPKIIAAISQDPAKTIALLNVADAPYVISDPNTIIETVVGVLTYNLFIVDAIEKLGGQPFDNQNYVYSGSGDPGLDALINQTVQRYSADKEATKTIRKLYETSGNFKKPLIKSHTTGDPIARIWNMTLYQEKVPVGKLSLFEAVPINRYGHCTFTELEAVQLFSQLLQKVDAQKEHPLAKVVSKGGKVVSSVTITPKLTAAK